MITFCPSTDFATIARCLDDKRLGGQRNEAWSILKWLRNPDRYSNFVAAGYCAMWKGYEPALVAYTNAILIEWDRRGKKSDLLKPFQDDSERNLVQDEFYKMPLWWGNEDLHTYHQHALVAKLPDHYKDHFPDVDGSLYNGSYPWPREIEDGSWVLRWPKACKMPDKIICQGDCTVSEENVAALSSMRREDVGIGEKRHSRSKRIKTKR